MGRNGAGAIVSTQNAPAVTTKFGNRLRAIADMIETRNAGTADEFAQRIRRVADEIDEDHTETLAMVRGISLAIHDITAVSSACHYCGSYIDANHIACPRCGWKVGA